MLVEIEVDTVIDHEQPAAAERTNPAPAHSAQSARRG
jgi:hypothetical protein